MDLKVSVIIPCFNNSEFIAETLDSVLKQSYASIDCIVVDDGSTDSSVKLIKSFADQDVRVQFFSRPQGLPKGANSCRNYGASLASGDILLFLDADDLLSEDCIERRLSTHNNADLHIGATGNFTVKTEEATPFAEWLDPSQEPKVYLELFLQYLIPWHTSSGLWKRAFFEKIGGFNLQLQRFQDVEIHVRALQVKEMKLSMDLGGGFTSYYRKSAFHSKMTIEKRRFILDQGIQYLSELDKVLSEENRIKTEGTLLYLLFRFEEVVSKSDVHFFKAFLIQSRLGKKVKCSRELKLMMRLFENTSASRFRKLISYGLFRTYSKRLMRHIS